LFPAEVQIEELVLIGVDSRNLLTARLWFGPGIFRSSNLEKTFRPKAKFHGAVPPRGMSLSNQPIAFKARTHRK